MGTIALILFIIAAVLFALATIGVPGIPPRLNLVAGGLFSALVGFLVDRIP